MGRRLRASTEGRSPAASEVVSTGAHPAWEDAVQLAAAEDVEGGARRIEILDERTVIIRNRPVR